MRVVIAGASGFMGTHLSRSLRELGHQVDQIGRSTSVRWGQTAAITGVIDGADVLVNLAGKSVNCRYGPKNRQEILRSRVDTTQELADAIRGSDHPPPLWINSSTATIYRHAEDQPMAEATGEIGTGFSVSIATAWEEAFFDGDLAATRRIALRTAIVLGNGGALSPMMQLARFGLGGPQRDGRWCGSRARRAAGTFHEFRARGGRQKFSWVHVDDVLGVILFLTEHPEIDGVVNVSSPNPSDNRTLMRTIRRVLRIPAGLPTFRWMAELGAIALRTETELILKSRWVIPERLVNAGCTFRYPELEPALRQIVSEKSGK